MANKSRAYHITGLCLMLFAYSSVYAQPDTSVYLGEIKIAAYFTPQPVLLTPSSTGIIDSSLIHAQHGQSLVPAMNTMPGVRMEERSPGSYRLSIRGSLLRSPFGIRNIKVYLDEFPLTDATGNTYLNMVDVAGIQRIEVIKGPDGSLFGANTGGVVQLQVRDTNTSQTRVRINGMAGSYGLLREDVGVSMAGRKAGFNLDHSWQQADGYRANSSMNRKTFRLGGHWQYHRKAQLRLVVLYTDMDYLTPGGLTLAQFNENPRAARPGFADQKAGIKNKTVYGGLSHALALGKYFSHVVAVFGAHTDFENPFFSNYEQRTENNMGIRTWLAFNKGNINAWQWQAHIGVEAQQNQSEIVNYGNNRGLRDTLQAADDIIVAQAFAFARMAVTYKNKFTAEAAVSYNYNHFDFTRTYPVAPNAYNVNFNPQWMPRVAVAYKPVPALAWRASVSKGYSPPTLAEIRSSDNQINTALQPEQGWNYETGLRLNAFNGRLYADAAVFYYALNSAIVRRVNQNGAEYFTNAGGTQQPGIELQCNTVIVAQKENGFIRGLKTYTSYAYSRFTFDDYTSGDNNYSGNALTGVPQHVAVAGLHTMFPFHIGLFMQYHYTSDIPLNDANSVYANAWHLVQAKISWQQQVFKQLQLNVFAGADNLLDQTYSLGNDLNAFGGRYYNAAPGRNYYAGLGLVF